MAINHKLNTDELKACFEAFLDYAVKDRGNVPQGVMDFLDVTLEELAQGQDILITPGPHYEILKDFLSCFKFDDINGGYRFVCGNCIAEGGTTPQPGE